jgi:4-hydroxybenzoate polyprenyltransferase
LSIRKWLKALRLRHWSKNLLVFLPGLLAHRILQPAIFTESLLAFAAFCLCASSVYLTNDLVDLEFDRRHPTKRYRPLASAQLTPRAGTVAAVVLLLAAAGVAATLGSRFIITLATYYALTWLYSLAIRRIVVADVMALAGLYAARIVAGAAATAIPLSSWFLAFSFFMFLSLAMVKRFSEISEAIRASAPLVHGRAYRASDLPVLLTVGAGSGLGSVLVMAIYINSSDAALLYSHREVLWAVCLFLLYWIIRIWIFATRGEMPEDPVAFSTSDPTSFLVLGLTAAAVLLAI